MSTSAPRSRATTGRSNVVLVARREVRERMRAKSFRWATAILVAAVVLGVALPKVLGGDKGTKKVRIGVTAAVPADVRGLLGQIQTAGSKNESHRPAVAAFDTEARGRQAVVDGKVSFLVTPDRLFAGRKVVADDGASESSRTFAAARELLRLRSGLDSVGVRGEQATRALSAPPLRIVRLAGKASALHKDQLPLATAATVLMYVILIIYGQMVAGGVNEEKSSRVVELLLSSMRPRQLLTGKVTGIGLVGLVQVALLAAAAGITALVVGVDLPSGSTATALAYVVWFALAYALYCTLFAAAGSLTSRAEESQQAATPVIILLVVAYGGAFATLKNPGSTLAVVLSFVPFTAPMVMPARAAIGAVPLWQVGASMLLTLAAIVVVNRLAGRIYAGALLRFGPKVKIREALRSGEPGRIQSESRPNRDEQVPAATGS